MPVSSQPVETLAQTLAPTLAAARPPAPRLQGALDMLRPDRVGGWVVDRANRTAAVEVDVLREGVRVGTVRADRARKDLARGEDATGNHGFLLALDPPLEPGFEFTVTAVARAADGTRAELRRPGPPAGTPERRLMERIFEELSRLRAAGAEAPELTAALERVEVAQARLEAALAALEAPPPPAAGGLKAIVALALITGVGSLALGIWSMLAP